MRAALDPSGTPAGFTANGFGGEGCWGEAADAEPNVVVEVGRAVAVPVGRAAEVGTVEPRAAAQHPQLRHACHAGPKDWRGRNPQVWFAPGMDRLGLPHGRQIHENWPTPEQGWHRNGTASGIGAEVEEAVGLHRGG